MEIHIKTIPHKDQKYETVGNYGWNEDGSLWIEVSETGNENYNFLIALHEFLESYAVKVKGIKVEEIDKFDIDFEEMRAKYPHIVGDKEPGDDENAPYYNEHQIASRLEKWFADILLVNWNDYTETINNLK